MPEKNNTSSSNPLEEMRNEAFSQPSKKDVSLSVIEQQREVEFYKLLSKKSPIDQSYHYDIIKTAKKVINVAIISFIVVIVFIGGIVFYGLTDKQLSLSQRVIPLIFGGFTELLSATIIALMNTLIKSKDNYFRSNNENERLNKAMGLVQTMKDGEAKNQMIGKIVDSLCNDKPSINNDKQKSG